MTIAAVAAILCAGLTTQAAPIKIAGLIGGDLTDVDDVHNEGAYNPPGDYGGFDAEFFSTDEPGFGGGEYSFNVFDNGVGGGGDKWCCNAVDGDGHQLDARILAGAHILTSFTFTTSNDSPQRDPVEWYIKGSNDGTTWTNIYSTTTLVFDGDRSKTWQFTGGGVDFATPAAYSWFRYDVRSTGSATQHAVGEIEYFGTYVPPVGAGDTLFWDGDTGNWTTPDWLDDVPGTGSSTGDYARNDGTDVDRANITEGTVTVNTNEEAYSLLMDTGTAGSGGRAGDGTLNITANKLYIYTDATISNSSTVAVSSGATLEVDGTLTIDPGTTFTNSGTVDTVTLDGTGTATLAASSKLIAGGGSLGTIALTGNAEVEAGGNVTVGTLTVPVGVTLTKSGSETLEVTGPLTLVGQILKPTDGTLELSGVVDGSVALDKQGAGTLLLSNNNTYTGVTTVSEGILSITNGGALGDTSSGTVVSSGGQLRLGVNNITVDSGESISIAGDGPGSGGAIYAQAGNNMNIDGPVSLAANSRINVAAGASARLRLRSGLALNDKDLTVVVAGSGERFEINTAAMTGSGNLTLEGDGRTELKVANPGYTGLITVNAGYLSIFDGGALGDTGGGTVINSGAQLRLETNNITVDGDESISIAGTGPGNGGAIYAQAGGNMNIDGPVSLAANSRINVAAGASARLRLRGGLALNDKNLTVVVAGSGERLETTAPITGSGALTLEGNGRTELKVANPGFTGTVNLTSGSMDAVAGALGGTSAVTVGAGASLDVAGGLMNDLTVNGDATTSANMTVINNLTVNSTSLQAGANVVTIGTGATMNLGTTTYTVTSGDVGVSGTVSATKPDALILNGAVTVTTPGPPTGHVTSGLLGMWTFDDGTASDLSGNGHDGIIAGSPTISAADRFDPGAGQSIDFNGGDSGVIIGGAEDDFDVDTITIVTWVKEQPDGQWEPYIAKRGENSKGYQLRRRHNTNEITFTTRGPSGGDDPDDVSNRTAVVAQNQGNWYQLIARYDGVRRQIIINGDTTNLALDIASTGNINDGPERLVFGARMKNGESGTALGNIEAFSKTKLDDIFIYNRALTDAEVATMYNGGAALPRAAGAGAAAVGDLRGNGTIDASGSGGIEVTGTWLVEVDGSGAGSADMIAITGALDITGATIDFDEVVAVDDLAYIFASYTTLSGPFAAEVDVPFGYYIDYNYLGGSQIALVVPEPGTMALLGLGGAVILIRRRRRA